MSYDRRRVIKQLQGLNFSVFSGLAQSWVLTLHALMTIIHMQCVCSDLYIITNLFFFTALLQGQLSWRAARHALRIVSSRIIPEFRAIRTDLRQTRRRSIRDCIE